MTGSEGWSPLRHHFGTGPYPTPFTAGHTLAANPRGGERPMPKSGNFVRTFALVALTALIAVAAVGTAGASPAKHSATTLSGAGSSFVSPLVSQWVPAIGA